MKRKTFLKKKPIYDNKKYLLKDLSILGPMNENNLLSLRLFCRNFLIKNFFYYNFFLTAFKKKSNIYYLYNYINYINNIYALVPFFLLNSQSLAKNIDIFFFLKKKNIIGFFAYKKLIELNYKFFKKYSIINVYHNYSFFLKNVSLDNFKDLASINEIDSKKIYFFIKNKNEAFFFNFNIFNFNIFFLCNLEIYKILILMSFKTV